VKPGPDPDRKKETQYLSPRDLKVETRLPSKKWIKAGSGTLGRACINLKRKFLLFDINIKGKEIFSSKSQT
jgi:hypothetical protein